MQIRRSTVFSFFVALFVVATAGRVSAYTLNIPGEESSAFRFVPTSGREYAITLLGRRAFLLLRTGHSLRNPAIPKMTGSISNGVAVIRCPDFAGAGATLTFTNGVLARIQRKKGSEEQKAKDLKLATLRSRRKNPLLMQWPPPEARERNYWGYWTSQKGFSRLRLWFFNPNGAGAFFAELALFALALALLTKRLTFRVVGGLLFAAFLWCELKTGSRGSFLGLFAGSVLLALLVVKRAFTWKKAVALGSAVLGFAALTGLGLFGTRMGAKLFAMTWSNVARLHLWREAPRMLAAAPGGWGVNQSGAAFCDWFQEPKVFDPFVWLVNSHLTWIVELGCWFCVAYSFIWFAVFLLSFRAAWRGNRVAMVVLGLAVVLFVSAWFSTVGVFVSLWVLPGIALGAFLFPFVKNFCRVDAVLLVTSLLLAAVVPFAVIRVGRGMEPAPGAVRHISRANGVTVVGEGTAAVYLVPDKEALSAGGGMGRDVRRYQAHHPKASAVAIADSVACLPKQLDRLVLVGRACADYMLLREKHLGDGAYPRAKHIVMISPPFSPDVVPATLVDGNVLTVVYGAFSRRLDPKMRGELPKWVQIVENAELYVPQWTRYLWEGQ